MNEALNIISLDSIRRPVRVVSSELLAPATEEFTDEALDDHAADPIKSMDDIERISEYLIENGRYRDNMMFIVGINFGLRASDLRMLRFSNLINENNTFRDSFAVFEKKTRNTRKRKKNRYITINDAVIDAVLLFLENTPGVTMSDYLFRTYDHRHKDDNSPITVRSMNRIMKGIAEDLSISAKMSTHTLRKTFCYHQMVMSNNDSRKLLLLQKMLNHSSPAQTLDYIGITSEEIHDAYKALNLGSKGMNYLRGSNIYERDDDNGMSVIAFAN